MMILTFTAFAVDVNAFSAVHDDASAQLLIFRHSKYWDKNSDRKVRMEAVHLMSLTFPNLLNNAFQEQELITLLNTNFSLFPRSFYSPAGFHASSISTLQWPNSPCCHLSGSPHCVPSHRIALSCCAAPISLPSLLPRSSYLFSVMER